MTSAAALSPLPENARLLAGVHFVREGFPARIAELKELEAESLDAAVTQAAYIAVLYDLLETADQIEQKATRGAIRRYEALWGEEDRLWAEWTARLSPVGAVIRFSATGLRLPGASSRRMSVAA